MKLENELDAEDEMEGMEGDGQYQEEFGVPEGYG